MKFQTKPRKKIFLLFAHRKLTGVGGIETFIENFVQHGNSDEFELHVLAWTGSKLDSKNDLAKLWTYNFQPLSLPRGINSVGIYFGYREIVKATGNILRQLSPDVVLTRDPLAVLAFKKEHQDVPVLFHPGSFLFQDLNHNQNVQAGFISRLLTKVKIASSFLIERKAFRSADIVGMSSNFYESKAKQYFQLNEKKLARLGEGISPNETLYSRPKELPANMFTILSVGRLDKSKNFSIIPKILSKIPKEVHWVLIGNGMDAGTIKDNIARKGQINRFTHISRVERLEPYYQHCQLLVHPSYYEQFPLVILEAMYFGCVPVVLDSNASDVFTSNNEMITAGQTGFLTKNDPNAFAEKIEAIHANLDLLCTIAEKCKQEVRSRYLFHHYYSKVMKQVDAVLKKSK